MNYSYKDEYVTLYNKDGLEVLKQIPDKSVNLILTDPPYNIGELEETNITFKKRKNMTNRLGEWDKIFDPIPFLEEFLRVLKDDGNIFIFTSHRLIPTYFNFFEERMDRNGVFVWHKTNPTPQVRKVGFLKSCEFVFYAWNKGHKFTFKKQNEMHDHFESPRCMGKERLQGECHHPTQKPIKILKHLIEIMTDENDVVLDTFMGVGSTGVAAKSLKRKFIGTDINKTYVECATKRIKDIIVSNFEIF